MGQLYITGEIYSDSQIDAISGLVSKMGTKELIITSTGGDVFTGIAMANLLKNRQVTTIGTGLVASIATVILLAGDKVQMVGDSVLMIHNSWMFTQGNKAGLLQDIQVLKKIDNTILNVYMRNIQKNGKNTSRKKIKELMDKETFLSAEEALDLGLIDTVVDRINLQVKEIKEEKVGFSNNVLAAYNNFKNLNKKQEMEENKEAIGFMAKLAQLLGLKAKFEVEEEKVEEKKEEIKAAKIKPELPAKEKEESKYKAKLAKMEEEIKAAKAKAEKLEKQLALSKSAPSGSVEQKSSQKDKYNAEFIEFCNTIASKVKDYK